MFRRAASFVLVSARVLSGAAALIPDLVPDAERSQCCMAMARNSS